LSKTGGQVITLPPLLSDDENASIVETSTTPIVEELMKQIERLNAKLTKLKTKKSKNNVSASEDDDSSCEEDASNKAKKDKKKCDKSFYNAMSFNYNNMPSSMPYTSVPIGKAPYFDGTNYNQWKHCMKNYLYSISPEVWQVVCDGVDFLEDDEDPTLEQLQKIHLNAQAITILNSSVDKEEFNRVDDLEEAKDVWTTLQMAHEGSKPMRKEKIDMLEGQLNRFVMFQNEAPQDMFNRLNKLVNKAKAMGSKKYINKKNVTPTFYKNEKFCPHRSAYKKLHIKL
jgi:maltoporin